MRPTRLPTVPPTHHRQGNEVQYKEAELVHGRAAMLAFSAVVTQGAMNDAFGVGSQTFPYF